MKGNWDDAGKLILRLAVGGLLLFHGVAKLQHGVAWMAEPLGALRLPGFIAYGVYVGEVVAPLLIILGFWTRPAALVVAFNLLMAIALMHRGEILTIRPSGGWAIELDAFYVLAALALFFIGAGKYSVSKGKGALN